MTRPLRLLCAAALVLGAASCWQFDAAYDDCVKEGGRCSASQAPDAGADAGTPDAGGVDAGHDAGEGDAGTDAGEGDAGTDAGPCLVVLCLRDSYAVADRALHEIYGAPTGELFASGTEGLMIRWTLEAGWLRETLPDSEYRVYGVHGTGADNVWAVTQDPAIHHWDGSSWTLHASTAYPFFGFYSVHGSRPDDYWAVGADRSLWHFDGGGWAQQVDTYEPEVVNTLHTLPSGELLLLGRSEATGPSTGLVVSRIDGQDLHAYPGTEFLSGAAGEDPDDVWAVGDWGTFVHRAGGVWTVVNGGTTRHLYDVWHDPQSGWFWATGEEGTLFHKAPGAGWTRVLGTGFPSHDFRSVSGTPDGKLVIAANYWDSQASAYDGGVVLVYELGTPP